MENFIFCAVCFLKRRYPEEIVDEEMSKVKFNFLKKIKLKYKEEEVVPLIVTYHRSLILIVYE